MKMPDKKKKLCFVLMPFKDEMKEVYWRAIKPACEKAGFASLRVDELKGAFNINRKIIEHIFSSAAIVADLTEWNPNVFYEMGVAHALDNKTIMIIQKKDKLPFDVSNYRCIQYDQNEAGLVKLREDIVDSLQTLEEWCCHPTNPVQDFKPPEAFISQSTVEALQQQLRQKEALLRTRVPKTDLEILQKQLREKETSLEQVAKKGEALQNALAQKQAENLTLEKELQSLRQQVAPKSAPPPPRKSTPVLLRSRPLDNLSIDEAEKMLQKKGFFDNIRNASGKGLRHQYEAGKGHGARLAIDQTTQLMWQQSGSENSLTYEKAQTFVAKLNEEKFGGYNNWRLPTLEEAMSLIEPEKKNGNLHIDPVFDRAQSRIWTADKSSADVSWVVSFGGGGCSRYNVQSNFYVRAVRPAALLFAGVPVLFDMK